MLLTSSLKNSPIAQDLKDSDVDVLKIGTKWKGEAEQLGPMDMGNHSGAAEPRR
jgi:hypothetical protein